MDVVIQHYNSSSKAAAPSKGSKKHGSGFSRKCASLVKQQRTRIYILRRCATMLLCWYIQGDE